MAGRHTSRPRLPSLALEVTPRCNQHCSYCYNAWRGDKKGAAREPPLRELTELIDCVLADVDVGHFTLTGGEPFSRPDLLALIAHINGRGPGVTLISNAGLVTAELARELAALNVHYVQVTFTGDRASTHDALCGAGTFDSTREGVRELRTAGIAVGGSCLCTAQNFDITLRIMQCAYATGATHHMAFNRFNPSGHALAQAEQLMPTRTQVLRALGQAEEFALHRDLPVVCTMPIPDCMIAHENYPHVRFGACSAGTDQAEYAITGDGRLKYCTVHPQHLGSLRKQSIRDLIEQSRRATANTDVPPFCAPCPRRQTCRGGCRAAALWAFGSADEIDPFLARHVMVDYMGRLRDTGATTGRHEP
jgi:radical SAM protein with 4Fe4S-binding SPASM domain